MRNSCRLMLFATILLLSLPANAQQIATIGKEVPDIELTWTRAGRQNRDESFYLFRYLRGSIAVFYFWRSSNLDSVERLSEMQELHRKYADKGVLFVSVTADSEEKFNQVAEEHDLSFFKMSFWQSPGAYYLLGALSDPYVALVDPRGILAWRGVPDKQLEQRLADLIERTNPPAGNQSWLEQRFRQAERFFDQGEYGRAYSIALHLFRITVDTHPMHSRAQALMDRCSSSADEWLRQAIEAERDKDYKKAARIVAEIAVRFEEPEAEGDRDRDRSDRDDDDGSIKRRAEIEIGRMNGNRELKKLIREAQDNAQGELLNDRAAALEEYEYFIDARHIYEQVIKEYEDTDAAKEAKRRLRRIERDPDILKKVAERRARNQAARWLDLGERFAAIKMYAQARDYYQRVIDEYPDTTAATRAKERLSDLPEPPDDETVRAQQAADQP